MYRSALLPQSSSLPCSKTSRSPRYAHRRILFFLFLAAACLFVLPKTSQADIPPLHQFTGSENGTNCQSPLIQASDGNLYGTTYTGGIFDEGTVFKITPGGILTTLYSFSALDSFGSNLDGANPQAALVQANDGNLYGTTSQGGAGYGSVFRITLGGALSSLCYFGGSTGIAPTAALIQATDGKLYGVTNSGYSKDYFHLSGTVFQVALDGTLTVLHTFDSQQAGISLNFGLIQAKDGNLYGTTYGGSISNKSTIFQITLSGTFTTLHDFDGVNGGPHAALVQANDGNLYGTTAQGGTSYGSVFRIATSGNLTTLYSFSALDVFGRNADGADPQAALIQAADGNLYGTTSQGGINGDGTIFRITLGGAFAILHAFNGTDGMAPVAALVQGQDGCFYGTTSQGGIGSQGTVYQITVGGVITTLYRLSDVEGKSPQAALVQANDGNFYGTTFQGGSHRKGTIFKITPGGIFATLYSFSALDGFDNNLDGAAPQAALIQAADGNLYGTTSQGGINGDGTIFRITLGGAFAILHVFNGTDGMAPVAALVQGQDGCFYGTTSQGGTNNNGTIFKIGTSGDFTTLHKFSGLDGMAPHSALIMAPDDNFYGTSPSGGTHQDGTIFKIARNGFFTILYSFSALDSLNRNVDGGIPLAALIQATDGNLYGTTSRGGAYGAGTVFRITLGGTLNRLHSFSVTDGANPQSALIQATDGNLYGTTTQGGFFGDGIVFQITTNGVLTTPHSFDGADGANPQSALIQATDGTLYGTASDGEYGLGTIFRVRIAPTRVHLLWTNVDGSATLWNIDAAQEAAPNGNRFTSSTVFGPFLGWQATGLTTGPDGNCRILWTHLSDGQIALWNVDDITFTTGLPDKQKVYGPYANWNALSPTVGSDGTEHLLWNYPNGRTSFWSISQSSKAFSYRDYGPFNGWSAVSEASSQDITHLLWRDIHGAASLWTLDAQNNLIISPTFGPFPSWTPQQIAGGLEGNREILWTNTAGAASFWNVDMNGHYTIFPNPSTPPLFGKVTYGPYPDWKCVSITNDQNGVTRLLWSNVGKGEAALWRMYDDGTFSQQVYGPYAGWQCTAVSAGP